MHIILGALGSLVTILYLLDRLGIDLGGLNPWLWRRRKRWRDQLEGNPIFSITSPMEATAVLLTGVAKADGDLSSNEKSEILGIFESEFSLSKREAADLLSAAAYLLGRGDEFRSNVSAVIAPSLDSFTKAQADSAVELMQKVAHLGSQGADIKSGLIDAATAAFDEKFADKGKWS